jgi:hypothetical protein
MLDNAKEKFRDALRPTSRHGRNVRDYRESDAPGIVEKVKELGIIDSLAALSNSYIRFRDEVTGCPLDHAE